VNRRITRGRGDRPAYRQLATILRDQIISGELPAGAELPAEAWLRQEYTISASTVRDALAVLSGEGLITTERGRRATVRTQQPVRLLADDRYIEEKLLLRKLAAEGGEHPLESGFTRDHNIPWTAYTATCTVRDHPVTGRTAQALQVPVGTATIRREMVDYANGVPMQYQISCVLAAVAAGTPLADPRVHPVPGGVFAELASVGLLVDEVQGRTAARMPGPDEVEALDLPPGVPVLVMVRVIVAGGRPVEAAEIVYAADRTELLHRTDLRDV